MKSQGKKQWLIVDISDVATVQLFIFLSVDGDNVQTCLHRNSFPKSSKMLIDLFYSQHFSWLFPDIFHIIIHSWTKMKSIFSLVYNSFLKILYLPSPISVSVIPI